MVRCASGRGDRVSVTIDPTGRGTQAFGYCPLIPTLIDQNPWAHWRSPMDMMRQGWAMSFFQASQQ